MDIETKVTNKVTLARELAEILNIPYHKYGKVRKSESYKAVDAIFKVIKEALLRGEEVKIPGFGIFGFKRNKVRSTCYYFYDKVGKKGRYSAVRELKPRKYAHFRPSKVLKRMINPHLKIS